MPTICKGKRKMACEKHITKTYNLSCYNSLSVTILYKESVVNKYITKHTCNSYTVSVKNKDSLLYVLF